MTKRKPKILVFCAHNDDEVLGAGGTIVKYVKEGKVVYSIIFSYGESSHPWLQRQETVRMRVKEAQKADKALGIEKVTFFGLTEGKFEQEIKKKGIEKKILQMIRKESPEKIFTHSIDDPHTDHRAVVKTVLRVVDDNRLKVPVYSFDIWNPVKLKNRDKPKLIVDITPTFRQKLRAFRLHKSQWLASFTMIPATYIRAIMNGIEHNFRYAEVFIKLR
jgi:LmbE family N-acetylglucosaminyl deacetylase